MSRAALARCALAAALGLPRALTAQAAAKALFDEHDPEATRLRRLSGFFSPAPGSALKLDERDLRDFRDTARRHGSTGMRGFIRVRPPRGVCFTIHRASADTGDGGGIEAAGDDDVVCKDTKLAFTLGEMDRDGRLMWTVSTGAGDEGTPLSWRLPYRMALVTPFDHAEASPPVFKIVESCKASTDTGRRIELGLMTGETWIIRFPDVDTLLPQPPPIPNLDIVMAVAKISLTDGPKESGGGAHGGGEGAAPAKEHKADGEAAPKAAEAEAPAKREKIPDETKDRADWAIPLRGAYAMNASGFAAFGSVAPRSKGVCRYNYTGPVEDPGTGRIECHDTDNFSEVFIPLTCLGALKN